MTQTINRMFGTVEDANAAVAELKHAGYAEVYVVTPPGEGSNLDQDAIAASIMRSNVLRAQAKIFAVGVQNGGTLVTVHALFGTALNAINILESHNTIDSGYVEPVEPVMLWDDATPVSCMLQMPVLSRNGTPVSHYTGLPALASHTASLSGLLGLKLLSSGATALSSALGLPVLAHHSMSLSQKLGLPLLKS